MSSELTRKQFLFSIKTLAALAIRFVASEIEGINRNNSTKTFKIKSLKDNISYKTFLKWTYLSGDVERSFNYNSRTILTVNLETNKIPTVPQQNFPQNLVDDL